MIFCYKVCHIPEPSNSFPSPSVTCPPAAPSTHRHVHARTSSSRLRWGLVTSKSAFRNMWFVCWAHLLAHELGSSLLPCSLFFQRHLVPFTKTLFDLLLGLQAAFSLNPFLIGWKPGSSRRAWTNLEGSDGRKSPWNFSFLASFSLFHLEIKKDCKGGQRNKTRFFYWLQNTKKNTNTRPYAL